MIVDSSAIVALLRDEPDAPEILATMNGATRLAMSAGTHVELTVVIARRFTARTFDVVDRLMRNFDMLVEPVTAKQAEIARSAYRRFGQASRHRANLNFGDCFSYALAMERGEPLLFKGDDFTHTDVLKAI